MPLEVQQLWMIHIQCLCLEILLSENEILFHKVCTCNMYVICIMYSNVD